MKHNLTIQTTRQLSLLLVVAIAACFFTTPRAHGATPEGPCPTNANNRALDFWLGDWSITGPGSAPNAKSSVMAALDKCIIIENWDGGRGHVGENWFGYSADDKSWHGMFADNMGRVHIFVDGKVAPGSAEFSGPSHGSNGETFLNRVRIVRVNADKVEQIWEKSTDNGATWVVAFRGEYQRKK